MQQLLVLVMGGIGGALTTFLLQKYGCSAVVASCVVGLIGALIGHVLESSHLPLIIFAGSFVGMTSLSIGSLSLMLLGGALCGVIYKFSLSVLAGFGGRLGTIAFISTVLAFYMLLFLKNLLSSQNRD